MTASMPFYKTFIAGEYVAERGYRPWKWSYDIDLTPLKNPAAMAHVSWIKGETSAY